MTISPMWDRWDPAYLAFNPKWEVESQVGLPVSR